MVGKNRRPASQLWPNAECSMPLKRLMMLFRYRTGFIVIFRAMLQARTVVGTYSHNKNTYPKGDKQC
jgi:hypothetical protein